MAREDWGAFCHGGVKEQTKAGGIGSGSTGVAGVVRAVGSDSIGGSMARSAAGRRMRFTSKSSDYSKERQCAERAVDHIAPPRRAADNLSHDARQRPSSEDAFGSSVPPATVAARQLDADAVGSAGLVPSLPDAHRMALRYEGSPFEGRVKCFRNKLYASVLEWGRSFSASGRDVDTLADAHIISAGTLRFFANVRGDFTHAVKLWGAREGPLVACVLTWAGRDVMSTDTADPDIVGLSAEGPNLAIGRECSAGFVVDRRSHARKVQSGYALEEHIRQHFNVTKASMRVTEFQV